MDQKLNRRAMLLGAVFLVGGAAALTRFTRTSSANPARGPAFSADQFALLEQVTEVIIPATDTPGAIGVGVPVFIRDLLMNWGSPQSRAEIASVLEAIEQRTWAKHGSRFLELPDSQRLDLMRSYDEDSIKSHDPAYRKFKHMVLLGYYHSEIGATQELRFELVPGAWRSCMPLNEVGRATAFWT
ncbi:MAG: gluconate 2-dehydrogenase subunit 3 family protein [Pseudomonadota bacterium]